MLVSSVLTNMEVIIGEFCAAFGQRVSEGKAEMMHMPEPHASARTL